MKSSFKLCCQVNNVGQTDTTKVEDLKAYGFLLRKLPKMKEKKYDRKAIRPKENEVASMKLKKIYTIFIETIENLEILHSSKSFLRNTFCIEIVLSTL